VAGAGDRNRTRNLLFTKQLLCQLSYAGILAEGYRKPTFLTWFESNFALGSTDMERFERRAANYIKMI
jgi:hypothetical protein